MTETKVLNNEKTLTGAQVVTKYYRAGGALVGMRKGATLTYLFTDHLPLQGASRGSTTVSLTGGTATQQRYKPWGEVRGGGNALPTDNTYTGQKTDEPLGLMFYNARWYDPMLGRFAQADSVIPNPTNPLDWNRYQYVNGNPINYNDPSGHDKCTGTQEFLPDCELINGEWTREWSEGEDYHSPIIREYGKNAIAPSGRKDSFVFAIGFPSSLHARNRDGMKIPTTLYWGLSIVYDNTGGLQLYSETLDIKFNPRLELGKGEQPNPSDLLGAGVSITKGFIWKNSFTTEMYSGEATSWGGGLDIVAGDYYRSLDGNLSGIDIGVSMGFPFSLWRISTYAQPITDRIDITFWTDKY